MPVPPKNGQGKSASTRPPSSLGMTTRSQSKNLQSSPTPSQQSQSNPSSHASPAPPAGTLSTSAPAAPSATPKVKSPKTNTAFTRIITMLDHILAKFNPPGQIKQALTEVLEVASKAAEEEKNLEANGTLIAIKSIHDTLKADFSGIHAALDEKFSALQENQNKLLSATETLGRSTENLQSTTKDLENKVVKVTDTTDRIANTTQSYRDVLMDKSSKSHSLNADPRLLRDRDRKARQLMLGYNSVEENATLNMSLTELRDKANKIVADLVGTNRPDVVQIESVTRTRGGSLLLLLNSKEAADWLKDPSTEYQFLDKYAIGASIKDRDYNVLVRWVPIIFDPENRAHHRDIEAENNLPEHSIHKARWIKPINRRNTGQTRAHAIFTIASAESANKLIRDGLAICGVKARVEKTKQEPLQCLKCRGWEHKAQNCETQVDTCGTCGEDHRTSNCQAKGKLYCASCKSNDHASWDRNCPEFVRRCSVYDERNPENNTVYFPTDQDWTLTTKPPRIPLSERFPQQWAIKSLPSSKRKPSKPVVRLPPSRSSANPSTSRPPLRPHPGTLEDDTNDVIDSLRHRTGANLIPLGNNNNSSSNGREEGDLSSSLEYESCLELPGADWRTEPNHDLLTDTWLDTLPSL